MAMLVFAAEFPASEAKTLFDFIEVCHIWLTGSPHHGLDGLPEFVVPHNDIVDISEGGHQIQIGGAKDEEIAVAGLRDVWIENDTIEWTTEVVASQADNQLRVSVHVLANRLVAGTELPSARKPQVIKRLFERLGGGVDGELPVQDRPHRLASSQLDLAMAIIEGKSLARLPVVYVSADFDNRPTIDVARAARNLGGLAHVLVEPNRSFSHQLAKRVAYRNAYGGAVGIYWPRATENELRFLPRDFHNSDELEQEVADQIRAALTFAKTSNECTWAALREAISTRKIEALKAQGGASVDEWIRAFDEEREALRAQLAREEARVTHYQERMQEVQSRAAATRGPLLHPGVEQEFYLGEVVDVLLSTLQEDMDALTPNSRRAILIRDVLEANQKHRTDWPNRLEEGIKASLSSGEKLDGRGIAKLEKLGFSIEDGGKHYKATFSNDSRFMFTLSKTPSDSRGGKNVASVIIKKLLRR